MYLVRSQSRAYDSRSLYDHGVPRRGDLIPRLLRSLACAILAAIYCSSASARVWRVTPEGTGDAPTIQAAIDSASAGDEVVLAPGRYTWTSQGATSHSMVQMRAGVTLRGEAGAASTILDAEERGRVVLCINTGPVTIEGLTIERGVGRGTTTPPYVLFEGGGVLADPASTPTIVGCVIRRNVVTVHGGTAGAGVYCTDAVIRDCEILDNHVASNGAGVGVLSQGRLAISGSRIEGNVTSGDPGGTGGGIWAIEAEVTDRWFEDNRLTGIRSSVGGGAFIGRGSVSRSVFLNNLASSGFSAYGGGLVFQGPALVTDCMFIGNVASGYERPGAGGAIASLSTTASVTVSGSTFIGNRATGFSFPPIQNIGGIAAPVAHVSGCIIAWSEGLAVNSTMTTSCTNFFGNSLGDELRGIEQGGNFSLDPEFCAVDPQASVSVGLQADSPCAPGLHPEGASCGRIGAGEVACAAVSVQHRTWGQVKSLYRQQ